MQFLTACFFYEDPQLWGRTGWALSPTGQVQALVNSCGKGISEIWLDQRQPGEVGNDAGTIAHLNRGEPGDPTYLTFSIPYVDDEHAVRRVEGWDNEPLLPVPVDPETLVGVTAASAKNNLDTGPAEANVGQIWALDRNEVFVGWQRQKMSRADFFNCDIPTPPLDPELRDSYGSKVDGYDSPSDYPQVPWRDEPPR